MAEAWVTEVRMAAVPVRMVEVPVPTAVVPAPMAVFPMAVFPTADRSRPATVALPFFSTTTTPHGMEFISTTLLRRPLPPGCIRTLRSSRQYWDPLTHSRFISIMALLGEI
jgi:hypothetical protein